MIESFKHCGLKRLYERDDRGGLQQDMVNKIVRILATLDSAKATQDLDIPGYRLHPLKGDLTGLWGYRAG